MTDSTFIIDIKDGETRVARATQHSKNMYKAFSPCKLSDIPIEPPKGIEFLKLKEIGTRLLIKRCGISFRYIRVSGGLYSCEDVHIVKWINLKGLDWIRDLCEDVVDGWTP